MYPYYQPVNQMAPQIKGHIVNDANEISPGDVPMDGSIAVFPKSDYSEIYLRSWRNDGTIVSYTFRPETNEKVMNTQNFYEEVLNRLDQLVGGKHEPITNVE